MKYDIVSIPIDDPDLETKTKEQVDNGFELYDVSGKAAKFRKLREGADAPDEAETMLAKQLGSPAKARALRKALPKSTVEAIVKANQNPSLGDPVAAGGADAAPTSKSTSKKSK